MFPLPPLSLFPRFFYFAALSLYLFPPIQRFRCVFLYFTDFAHARLSMLECWYQCTQNKFRLIRHPCPPPTPLPSLASPVPNLCADPLSHRLFIIHFLCVCRKLHRLRTNSAIVMLVVYTVVDYILSRLIYRGKTFSPWCVPCARVRSSLRFLFGLLSFCYVLFTDTHTHTHMRSLR